MHCPLQVFSLIALMHLEMLQLVRTLGPSANVQPGCTYARLEEMLQKTAANFEQRRRGGYKAEFGPFGFLLDSVKLCGSTDTMQLLNNFYRFAKEIGPVPIVCYEHTLMDQKQQWLRQLSLCICSEVRH